MPSTHSFATGRRGLLKAGAALAAGLPAAALSRPARAQGKVPTKVLDFTTFADVAKAEQEGALVFYCHENEAGTAAIAAAFNQAFPKIRTSYVRAQTGALYTKLLAERSAGRYDVDALQLSDIEPALDFQKRGGYMQYVSPQAEAYSGDYLSDPVGSFFWTGITFAGLGYNKAKVAAADAPKTWKDLLNPAWRNAMSCKIVSSGTQFVQWYELRKIYGDGFWKEFAKQRPRGFDSRVQLFDRLAKGDDKVCACAEYGAYVLYKDKAPDIAWVAPPEGLTGTPLLGRRGRPRAPPRSRQAVRRLGDVAARAEVLPGRAQPDLRLAARRRPDHADRHAAARLQAAGADARRDPRLPGEP